MSNRSARLTQLVILLWFAALLAGCASTASPGTEYTSAEQGIVSHPTRVLTIPAPASIIEPPSNETGTPEATPTPVPSEVEVRPVPADSAPHITLDVELFYADRWMRVRQMVEVENTTSDAWDEMVFNVPLNATPDLFFMDGMTATLGGNTWSGFPSLPEEETTLRVPLPRSVQPGEVIQVEMRYRIVIPPVEPTAWPPIGTTGWRFDPDFDLIQAGEWYPALVPYIDGEGWYTWAYHPVGDPTVYPLVNYDLIVTTEEDVTVASGGLVGHEENEWRFEVKGGRGIAFVASNDYQVTEGDVDGLPVRSYYLAAHEQAGQDALDMAANALYLFNALYGPYPYDSLTVAENGFMGGMEYSAFITISDYTYITYQGEPPSVLEALIAHETAHQWWYGAVGNDQVYEPWLDESLAFYSELIYFEHYHPNLTDWWWVKRVFQYHPYGPVDVTIYDYERSSDFILSMYGQAAQFMHELRGLMGDEAFFTFLKDYYATYSGQTVTGLDFIEMAQAHTAVDLEPLFEAYFSGEGFEEEDEVRDEAP